MLGSWSEEIKEQATCPTEGEEILTSLAHLLAHSETSTTGQRYNLQATYLLNHNYMELSGGKGTMCKQLGKIDWVDHGLLASTLGTAIVSTPFSSDAAPQIPNTTFRMTWTRWENSPGTQCLRGIGEREKLFPVHLTVQRTDYGSGPLGEGACGGN